MAQLSLALLGPPIAARDGVVVSFDTKKAIALLAVLAVSAREQQRDRLAALFWPESDDARAHGSLRRTLSVTVAAMGEGLAVTRTTVAIRPEVLHVDVMEFENLAARSDLDSLARAERVYRDDLLAGFSLRDCPEFDDWQAAASDRFRQSLAGVLDRLAAGYGASGDQDRAVGYARRRLALDPLHEPAHQALIRLLGVTGRRSDAMRQYRDLVRILERELAVSPLPETTRLYDAVRMGRLDGHPGSAALSRPAPGRAGPGGSVPGNAAAGGTGHARAARAAAVQPAGVPWPLAGRAAELDALDAAWRSVAADRTSASASGDAGGGAVVALTGEAGSGKSMLVAEFRDRVRAAGGTVLSGRCHDGEADLPFALCVDLLGSALSASGDLAARLPAHVADTAAALVPELATGRNPEAAPLAGPAALARLFAATATVLEIAASSAGGSGVVIVDDLHCADGPSLDFLGYLIRRLARWPCLLVLTWRGEQVNRLDTLDLALADARAAGRGTICELRPLQTADVALLLAAAGLGDADAGTLLRETRGNPMLVREYAAAMLETGEPPRSPSGSSESGTLRTPEAVRSLLGRRLRTASESASQLLATAAVLGGGCDADVLRAVSGRSEAETVDSIDEAISRLLLVELPPLGEHGPPRYEFPHEALRRVAYESATLARRRLLHSRSADVLAGRYARDQHSVRAEVIAGHLERGGREAEAASWWWQAAARARDLYAHEEALAHLHRAQALGYPPAECAVALGDELTVLGRYREALGGYESAASAIDGDGALLAGIEHKLAEVHHRLGDWQLADAHLAAAADLVAAGDLGDRARIAADRAVVAYRLGANDEASRFGIGALDDARRAADPAAIGQAMNVLGMLAAGAGDRGRAEEALRASLAQARSIPDHGATAASLNNLARLLADDGRLDEALELAEEALRVGSELGDQHRVAALHSNLADLLHASGRRDEAVDHLKEAARRFAAVDTGGAQRPEIWTLVEW